MSRKRNDRLEELFSLALEQSETDRDAWLTYQCGDDLALLASIRELLAFDTENEDGLLDGLAIDPSTEQVPSKIGTYRVTRLLGAGGMSTVFEGVHGATGGRAAIKLIRVGMATKQQMVRFGVEAELLAKLNHPGIAHLYDAGQADVEYSDGTRSRRMFLAMEFVDGTSITKHCSAQHLSIRQRVEILEFAARAAQHAHEKGVIHRDIKPANIVIGADGMPKVVDFGIGKLMQADAHLTISGVVMGTPSYMSPEQMAGKHDLVDTRTDVYSLGAVLYELLAGKPPIEAPLSLTPSAALTILHAGPRRLISLKPDVPRDLDAIVHKALNYEADKRYASAGELANDLHRWLNDLPVEARPPSVADRLRLEFRRHPTRTVAIAISIFSFFTLGSLALWQAVVATRAQHLAMDRLAQVTKEKTRADEQTKVAEAVSAFMREDVLGQADSRVQADAGATPDPDIKISAALDRAAAGLEKKDGKFKNEPLVSIRVHGTLGDAYYAISKFDKAEGQYRLAADLADSLFGPKSLDAITLHAELAKAMSEVPRLDESIALFKQAISDARTELEPDAPVLINALSTYAQALFHKGDYAGAVEQSRESVRIATKRLGAKAPDTQACSQQYALMLNAAGQVETALEIYLQLLKTREETSGPDHPDTILVIGNIASCYFSRGDLQNSARYCEIALKSYRRSFGNDHSDTLTTMNNLATIYAHLNKPDLALPLGQEAYERSSRTLGLEHPITMASLTALVSGYVQAGDFDKAIELAKKQLEINARTLGPDHPNTLSSVLGVATCYRRAERPAEGLAILAPVMTNLEKAFGADHPMTLFAMRMQSTMLADQNKFDAAIEIMQQVVERSRRALGPNAEATLGYVEDLALDLDRSGKADEAFQLRATTRPATSHPAD